MRDFQAEPGFPDQAKRATIQSLPPRAIGRARFHAYILRSAIDDVVFSCSLRGDALPPGRCRRREPESENDVFDIYTIIFLALAVFIFLRLRNVLGQRTGSERPPFDRAARNAVQGAPDNNVVPIPGKIIDQAPLAPSAEVTPPGERWKGLAEPGSALALGLDAIAAQDSSFDPRHFLSGARGAYEMIVLAFANGDRRALRDLLSSEVYRELRRGDQGSREARTEDGDALRVDRQGRTGRRRGARPRRHSSPCASSRR